MNHAGAEAIDVAFLETVVDAGLGAEKNTYPLSLLFSSNDCFSFSAIRLFLSSKSLIFESGIRTASERGFSMSTLVLENLSVVIALLFLSIFSRDEMPVAVIALYRKSSVVTEVFFSNALTMTSSQVSLTLSAYQGNSSLFKFNNRPMQLTPLGTRYSV